MTTDSVSGWLVRDTFWSRAAVPLAGVLLLRTPLARRRWGHDGFFVYLQLPLYMLHQYEEHGHGAFKAEINRLLRPRGRQITDTQIFVINILGVWGVDCVALYLTRRGSTASGLAAAYLSVVNGLLHAAVALRLRRYNPGLWTALLLLLPCGTHAVRRIGGAGAAHGAVHARGLLVAVVVHLLTLLSIMRRPRAHPSPLAPTASPRGGTTEARRSPR